MTYATPSSQRGDGVSYNIDMQSSKSPTVSPKAMLDSLGLSPRKRLGQNFLVGTGVVNMIVRAADIKPNETIVEVGPGLGILTRELVKKAGRVVAVEMDKEIAEVLEREVRTANLEVLSADAREVGVKEITNAMPYKLVANLPYYAASPILRHFLESEWPPVLAVIMVQREVAKQMVAQPGEMSLVSVGVQIYGKPAIVGSVPSSAFYPKPKVTSAVVRIQLDARPSLNIANTKAFFKVVRAGFSAPRKQMRHSLAQGLEVPPEEALKHLNTAGIDPRARAETLSLEQWTALYRVISDCNSTRLEVAER